MILNRMQDIINDDQDMNDGKLTIYEYREGAWLVKYDFPEALEPLYWFWKREQRELHYYGGLFLKPGALKVIYFCQIYKSEE